MARKYPDRDYRLQEKYYFFAKRVSPKITWEMVKKETGINRKIAFNLIAGDQEIRQPKARSNLLKIIEFLARRNAIRTRDEAQEFLQLAGEIGGFDGKLSEDNEEDREIIEFFERRKALDTQQKKRRDNRPPIITDILGREEEIARIISLIQKEEKLIMLVGTGGVGKTRIAVEITKIIDQRLYSDLPHSYRYVPLAEVVDPDDVPGKVAWYLEIQSAGSPESIIAALPSEPLLLVTDNLEHVLQEKKNFFVRLINASKKKPIVFLFTSRKFFNIPGENLVSVEPLVCPEDVSLIHNEADLKHYAATHLFYERASERDTARKFTETDAKYVARLCQALDGLPLAIEIAASRIRKYPSVQALYDSLRAKGIAVLENTYTGFDERHKTLEKTIKWSYDLLSPPEKMLFDRLPFALVRKLNPSLAIGGIFVTHLNGTITLRSRREYDTVPLGGCTAYEAYQICNIKGDIAESQKDMQAVLDELVDCGLLTQKSYDENARYSMLQTIELFSEKMFKELKKDHPEEFDTLIKQRYAYYKPIFAGEKKVPGKHYYL